MKRFLLALLFACLLPAQVLALDISPYALSVKGEDCWDLDLIALSQDDHWQRNHEPALERYQQGVCTYRLALPKGEGSYLPLLGEDGRMRLLARRSAGLTWQQKSYALHEIEGGALSGARSFEGAPYQVEPLGDGFAGVCADGDSASLLLCYDADMQVIATYAFPFAHAQIQATAQSGGKLYLLVAQGGYPHLPDDYVLRLEGGALEPVYRDASAKGSYNRMMPDGQGGVLLTGSLESDYKKSRVTRVSADGRVAFSKTLSVKNAIAQPRCTVPQPDGSVTFYGGCVSASRELHAVFSVTLDEKGRMGTPDVRNVYVAGANDQDNEPQFILAKDGAVLVYLRPILSRENVQALIPFDELPGMDDPGIALK